MSIRIWINWIIEELSGRRECIYSVFVYAHNPNFTQGGIYTYGYKPKSRYKLSVFDFMVVRQTIPRFFIQKILLILVQINCIFLRLLMSYNLNSHNLKGIYLFVAMLSLLIQYLFNKHSKCKIANPCINKCF